MARSTHQYYWIIHIPTTYKSEQVLDAEAIYAVFYKDKSLQPRSLHSLVDYPVPKYKKFPSQCDMHLISRKIKQNV